MAREPKRDTSARDVSDVVSVIGPGMEITGDIKCDGTVRIEGKVQGAIRATKSVLVGRGGAVDGDIETQDVVVAGAVTGTVVGASRVELQQTCRIEGDIRSRRIKLDEGGQVEGRFQMGKTTPSASSAGAAPKEADAGSSARPSLSAASK